MNRNNILITIKKEIRSIFRDKKTLRMIFGFPLIIAVLIFLMGYIDNLMLTDDTTTYDVGFNYEITDVEKSILDEYNLEYNYYDSLDSLKNAYSNGNICGYVVYDKNENVYTIYSDTSVSSMNANTLLSSYLDSYNQYLGNIKLSENNINPEEIFNNFTVELKNVSGDEFSVNDMMIELIMSISFIYIIMSIALASVNMATSAIAVEKEHGTLETILTLPISKTELIIGKYLANVVIGTISSLIGFIITIISFVIAKDMFVIYEKFSFNIIGIIVGIIICVLASFLISGLAFIITSKAKSYKEAQAAGQILNYLCIIPLFMSYLEIKITNIYYLIPILNYSTMLNDLFTGKFEIINLLLTITSTVVCSIIMIYLLIKTFKSEKVLFAD